MPYFLAMYPDFFTLGLVLLVTGESGVRDRMGRAECGRGAGVGKAWVAEWWGIRAGMVSDVRGRKARHRPLFPILDIIDNLGWIIHRYRGVRFNLFRKSLLDVE